jgi:DNA-binding GntR family transcriptional regulator
MDEVTGQPKYQHVANELRRAISAGLYPVGSELPSTARLTETYSVSTTVVRAAVRELRDEGLVRGQPGKAVYVTAEPDSEPPAGGSLDERLRHLSDTVHAALRDFDARLAALEGRPTGQTD